MTTEAGKRLLACPSYHWQLCGVPVGDGPCQCDLPDAIAAIEAETVAAALARVKERTHVVLEEHPDWSPLDLLAAVFAIIEEEAAADTPAHSTANGQEYGPDEVGR